MAIQLSEAVRNAKANQLEGTVGTSAKLRIFTGAQPANCAAADSGTQLLEMDLPSDWLAAASGGAVSKLGTWQANASAAGVAGHFRIYNTGLTTCHLQGSVTVTSGGGDMEIDNTNIASGQQVTVTTATFTEGNS